MNNAGEADDNNGDETKNLLEIEIPADETVGGYASGPENLEHSSILPMFNQQPQQPLLIGKKRRRHKKKVEELSDGKSGTNFSQRVKKVITNCEHSDREFYAKGMCKNCYHKRGRNKPAECCPKKKMYALGLCQNCYMKHYGKEKRKESRNTRNASLTSTIGNKIGAEKSPHPLDNFSEKATKASKIKKLAMVVATPVSNQLVVTQPRPNSMLSDPTAPTTTSKSKALLTPKLNDTVLP